MLKIPHSGLNEVAVYGSKLGPQSGDFSVEILQINGHERRSRGYFSRFVDESSSAPLKSDGPGNRYRGQHRPITRLWGLGARGKAGIDRGKKSAGLRWSSVRRTTLRRNNLELWQICKIEPHGHSRGGSIPQLGLGRFVYRWAVDQHISP